MGINDIPVQVMGRDLLLRQERYASGGLALQLYTRQQEPFARLTVNIPERSLPEGEVWIKRVDGQQNLMAALVDQGIVECLFETVSQEFVQHYATRCRLLISITVPPVPPKSIGKA